MTSRRWLQRFAVLLLSFVLLVSGYAGYQLATGNVHRLPDGRVYRSGRLNGRQIQHLARAHGVKSILNLCGPGRGSDYRAETNECRLLGLEHVSVKLSARREWSEEQMDKVVQTLRDLPKPVLVHCTGGADRTGLACALYRMDIVGEPPVVALHELNLFYGHVPLFRWRYSIAMDRSFWSHVRNHKKPGTSTKAPWTSAFRRDNGLGMGLMVTPAIEADQDLRLRVAGHHQRKPLTNQLHSTA